jgi:hypothetical protein
MNGFKRNLIRHISNLPGWRTKRKIVVIESDDWGSIRMPSNASRDAMLSKGIDLLSGDRYRYNMYDSLATYDDLAVLFETLSSVKDKDSRHCVFTAMSLVANPDFQKIEANDFHNYYFEPFTETLKRYPGCEKSFKLWQEGIEKHLFVPQFHGREHLNVSVWMRALQNNDPHTRLAFDYGMWGFNNALPSGISYQAAFDLDTPEELEYQKKVIASGLELFEKLHGYKATFFVPPNGPFNEALEEIAFVGGIRYMSTSKIHHEPHGHRQLKKRFHYLGQKNKLGQRYITRNCFFEPNQKGKDWYSSCLSDIEIAFHWHKPAVISTHRVNYIGALDPHNRDKGMIQLKQLLRAIVNKWPKVEFMTSDQLGGLMVQSKL